MTKKKAVFVHSSQLDEYSYPADCPFKTGRAGQLRKTLDSMGLLIEDHMTREVKPEKADRVVLEKFHTKRYLDAIKAGAKGDFDLESLKMGLGGPETPVFRDMYKYGLWSCGATITAGKLILSGEADIAFNPSGGYHHAGPEMAAGFCYINDVALGCLELADAGKRVLFLDIDAHYGDGVANCFYKRDDVMTISFHESGKTLFPWGGFENEIGEGAGRGYCVNVPFPADTYDQIYLQTFNDIAIPLIRAYDPDVIVFELGADGLSGDPLAHMQLTNNVYADIIYNLLNFKKPILMTGGGGYNPENTVRAWGLAWSVITGADEENQQMSLGLGGVMLESMDWYGGLRDREMAVTSEQVDKVSPHIRKTIEHIKREVFPIHGL